MQDIDFDELDRAVSSATGSPAEAPTSDEPTTSDDSVTVKTSAPDPASSTPAARRSSGRFMDVVHPSSDMRPETSERPVERSTPRPPEPRVEEPADRSTDWPDPLDFHGFTGDELDEKKEEEPKEEAPAEQVSAPEPEEPEVAAPLESPFLSGTKVEKRPLGAFSDIPEAPAKEPKEAEKTPEEPKLLDAPDEELLDAETAPEEPPKEEEKLEEPAPTPEPEEPTGPTSITQQYKEAPAKEETSGPIYAAEATTLALTHSPKKRSSAAIIIWILALILVGVGGGLAVYFLVLPTLHA